MASFLNPTAGGRIQAKSERWDGTSVRVTRTCADHRATNQGCAVDLGDGRCTRAVLAAAPGTVFFRDNTQGIIRIDHGSDAQGRWRTDYAHMRGILVTVGQRVTAGQQIGTISDAHDPSVTNFSGCHLHFGVLLNGVEQDPWPYLNQNLSGAEMDTVITRYPAPRNWSTKGGSLTGRRLDPAPLFKSSSFSAGSPAHSIAEYQITPTPAGWDPGPYQLVSDGFFGGYLVPNSAIDLGPFPVCPPADSGSQDRINELEAQVVTLESRKAALESDVLAREAAIKLLTGLIRSHVEAATKPEDDLATAAGLQ